MTFEKSNELYNIKRILGCVFKPIIKDIIAYDESTRVTHTHIHPQLFLQLSFYFQNISAAFL
jgi:hypothetical protein